METDISKEKNKVEKENIRKAEGMWHVRAEEFWLLMGKMGMRTQR